MAAMGTDRELQGEASGGNTRSTAGLSGDRPLIADHLLVRPIGRGSYGEVWLARSVMGQARAVKVIHREAFRDARPYDREVAGIRKFEPLSRSHEGLVDVLQVGRNDSAGYFYYVMELADDARGTPGCGAGEEGYTPRTLASELARRKRLPVEECLQLGLALTGALEHLHAHGLVHRDVKPSNIVFISGVPKLADIGLVTEISEARSFVGTEGFIPPEGPGTPQADVYSLGKVLYEAATGLDRHDFPELPNDLGAFTDPARFLELNEVLIEACRTEPGARYRSADAMRTDLQLLAAGRSVRRLRQLERTVTRLRRTAVAALAGVTVLSLLALPVYREWRYRQEQRQRRSGALMERASQLMEQGDYLGAFAAAAEVFQLDARPGHGDADHQVRLNALLDRSPTLLRVWSGSHGVRSVRFSPDGRRIAAFHYAEPMAVYDVDSGERTTPVAPDGWQINGAFSPDGRYLVCGEGRTQETVRSHPGARILDVERGKVVAKLDHPTDVWCAAFSPDGRWIATGEQGGQVSLWNATNATPVWQVPAHSEEVLSVAFNPSGTLVVSSSRDGTVRAWTAATGESAAPPLQDDTWVYRAVFDPEGNRVITCDANRRVRFWRLGRSKPVVPDILHSDIVATVECSPDGRSILAAVFDGTVRFWSAINGQAANPTPVIPQSRRALCAAFDSTGRRFVVGCDDGTIRLWDLAGSAAAPRTLAGVPSADGRWFAHSRESRVEIRPTTGAVAPVVTLEAGGPISNLLLDSVGRRLLLERPTATGTSVSCEVWDVARRQALGPAVLGPAAAAPVLSPDGARFALHTGSNVVQVYASNGGNPVGPPLALDRGIGRLAFSPDARLLVAFVGQQLHAWRLPDGRKAWATPSYPRELECLAFSPDGSRVALGLASQDLAACEVHLLTTSEGRPAGPPLVHSDGVLSVAFSPDGDRLVTGSEDFTAAIWNLKTGRHQAPLLRHRHQVYDASFASAGSWITTACRDRTVRLWDALTGEPVTPPLPVPGAPSHAVVLAEGPRLIAWQGPSELWVWDLKAPPRAPADWLALAGLLSPAETSANQAAQWEALRARHPDDYRVSTKDIRLWHELQLSQSRLEEERFGTVFHLRQLRALDPGRADLTEALEVAERALKE